MEAKPAILILEDSSYYQGFLIGAFPKNRSNFKVGSLGEIVFNTSMSGYQEIITDPSYKNQIVCFTYPSIGNYGINDLDNESDMPYLSGVVIKDYCETPSNYLSKMSLNEYLKKYSIPGIYGIDTRCLVRHIREKGELKAGIFTPWNLKTSTKRIENEDWFGQYLKNIQESNSLEGSNLTKEFIGGYANAHCAKKIKDEGLGNKHPRVAILDFGIKLSILNKFLENKILPDVFPGDKPYQNWENFFPERYQGFFLSNGPGDPSVVKDGIENTKFLLSLQKPIFGICLGYQILSIALGGSTYKMKFGHHSANHPVNSMFSKRVKITSQNHGFAVKSDFIKKILSHNRYEDNRISYYEKNLNDQTLEGFFISQNSSVKTGTNSTITQNNSQTILGTQYHPEASPGPRDGVEIFKVFTKILQSPEI